MATRATHSNDALPTVYDELVAIERLEYDEYNPRQVAPREELVRSIERDGIQRPLIVWPDDERDLYYITDGWQRYQAATQLGWEALPVTIYEGVDEALDAIEAESIVREWSTYTWATYCEALAKRVDAASYSEEVRKVAARVTRSETSVERYLAALSLPEEVHVLLKDGPTGSEEDWQALANHNNNVRRYGDLSWLVAAKLGRAYRAGEISASRAIALGANAVEYETAHGQAFVELGCEEPEWAIQTVHRMVQQEMVGTQYLQVPGVAVKMSDEEKQRVMEYCANERISLSGLVKEGLQEFATSLATEEA